jgi:hypothetical protein
MTATCLMEITPNHPRHCMGFPFKNKPSEHKSDGFCGEGWIQMPSPEWGRAGEKKKPDLCGRALAEREGFEYHPLNGGTRGNKKPDLERSGFSGEGGIRTLGGPEPTTVFETVPFNHSGTSPWIGQIGNLRHVRAVL